MKLNKLLSVIVIITLLIVFMSDLQGSKTNNIYEMNSKMTNPETDTLIYGEHYSKNASFLFSDILGKNYTDLVNIEMKTNFLHDTTLVKASNFFNLNFLTNSLVNQYDEKNYLNKLVDAILLKNKLLSEMMSWIGTPYYFGGSSKKGIDCSGFVQRIFQSVISLGLPRTAQLMFKSGENIGLEDIQFGDLVFFHTRKGIQASHVGIYIGKNQFVHSSSKHGVTVSSIEGFYKRRFIGASRVLENNILNILMINEN